MDTQHLGYPNDGGIAPANPSFTGNVDILQSATLLARLSVDSSGNLNMALTEKAPGALTCGLAGGGAGNVNNGAHLYKVTFVTAAGETEAGTASSAVTVVDKTADGKVALSAIPTGSSFVTARKIYRTLAGGTTYKLLTTINDNTSTTYTDNTADSGLTTTAPAVNTAIDTRFQVPNQPLTGYVAADVTYNNTAALTAVPGMSVTVETGGIYNVQLTVHSTAESNSLLMDFGGTVTPANFIGEWYALTAESISAADSNVARVAAIGTDFNGVEDGASMIYTFTGSLEVTTGGTFGLRGAQNAAAISDTKILRGSSLILTRLN